jgi:hypothetical protein
MLKPVIFAATVLFSTQALAANFDTVLFDCTLTDPMQPNTYVVENLNLDVEALRSQVPVPGMRCVEAFTLLRNQNFERVQKDPYVFEKIVPSRRLPPPGRGRLPRL